MHYIIKKKDENKYLWNSRNKNEWWWVAAPEQAWRFNTRFRAKCYLRFTENAPKLDTEAEIVAVLKSGAVMSVMEFASQEEAEACLESLRTLDGFNDKLIALTAYYSDRMSEMDLELSDLLHKVELDDSMNASERAVTHKKLRAVLKKRRAFKDGSQFVNLYHIAGIPAAMEKLNASIADYDQHIRLRTYRPRTNPALFAGMEGIETNDM